MTEQQSSYRQLFKSTTIFGGVQVVIIIVSIIKSKLIAILLGPTGMGIHGLFMGTINFIKALTEFGLERSAVKNIAAANGTNDTQRISTVIKVLKRLVWGTGLLGAFFTLIFSSYLSQLTFGDKEYTIAFIWLSITLMFNQLIAGEKAILRGLREIRLMAKASLWGSISGLIISIPIYYFWRLEGIAPAIIITAISTFIVTYYHSKKVKLDNVKLKKNDYVTEGKDMLKMGFFLSLNSLTVLGTSYLVRIFIRSIGSVDDVGFYTAGFAIVNAYFGVFFTSLTTDYYPKLASVASNNKKANLLMNQQSEMSVLIIAPVLTIFLVFINSIIVILYSKEFVPINNMILWAALGIYFKAASYSLGIIFISKGDVKTLFWSDFLSNVVLLILNLIGFKYWHLEGLGWSILLSFIFTFLLTFFIVRSKYHFSYTSHFYKIFTIQLLIGISCLFTVKYIGTPFNFIIGLVFILLSTIYSLNELNKRMGLKQMITNIRNRHR